MQCTPAFLSYDMDPLSITSAIVGFLQLTSQIATLASKVLAADGDSKKALDEISEEVRYFEKFFTDFKTLVETYGQTDAQSPIPEDLAQLQACLEKCNRILRDFLMKLQEANSSKYKAFINRFKWPLKEQERKNLIDLVQRCKASMQLDLSLKQSIAIQKLQHQEMKAKVIGWLHKVEVNSNLDRARSKCHPGTGKWFLQGGHFNHFKQETKGYLWLHGIPGCGKTVLSGSIIAALQEYLLADPSTGALTYFFFSYTDSSKRTAFNMLSTIAEQLCQQGSTVHPAVFTLYERNTSRPPVSVLMEIIRYMTANFKQTWIILDALDEIAEDEREQLCGALRELVSCSTFTHINILITSRKEAYLVDKLEGLPFEEVSLTTSLVDEDIKLYISELMTKETRFLRWREELRSEVVESLIRGAKGMFRWVECQVETLKKCLRPFDVKQALKTLPETLNETYHRMLLEIPQEYQVYVARLCAWIAFTSHPLELKILAEAIIFEPGSGNVDQDKRFADPKDIIQLCGSLFSIYLEKMFSLDNETRYYPEALTFSHYSVKEFLRSDCLRSDKALFAFYSHMDTGPQYIASLCIDYWSMHHFRYIDYKDKMAVLDLYNSYPLLHYATDSWSSYLACCPLDDCQRLEEHAAILLCNHPGLFIILTFDDCDHDNPDPLALFAYLGCFYAVIKCIQQGYQVNAKYSVHYRIFCKVSWRTPLQSAVQDLSPNNMLLLLKEFGAKDIIHAQDPYTQIQADRSPALEYIVHGSCERDVISMLLSMGSLVNSPHYPQGTLLISAERYNKSHPEHEAILQELSAHGGQLDPTFEREDGFIHSFQGEAVILYSHLGDIDNLLRAIKLNACVRVPVHDNQTVITLLEYEIDTSTIIYVAHNAFSVFHPSFWYAMHGGSYRDWDEEVWKRRFETLNEHGGDINGLDCIIGQDLDHLEYCTAVDLLTAFGEIYKDRKYYTVPRSPRPAAASCTIIEQCFFAISLLQEYGGKIRPRAPVKKCAWRIQGESSYYYGNKDILKYPSHGHMGVGQRMQTFLKE